MAEKQLPSTVHHHFRDVKLFKEQELGHGSFATVYRAQCDDLPCAAKVLHADFFDQQDPDPGEQTFISRFVEECKILPSITHPNIVQCFGTYQDPDTDLPVLLMEVMDESLTDYIERFCDPIPYHSEISFSYDIALGLSYLHSRGYVHRDLSSNNVLIMAGIRAKITDFGMCRAMTGPSHVSRKIRLTLCPGTHPFMPPEALLEPPTYTDRLDVFTLGVVMIQIMSRQYPNPGLAHKPLPFSMLLQAIPEEERRSNHIKLIRCDHPMLPLAKRCIQNRQERRPSSRDVCNDLRLLKESCEYQQSKDEASVERKLERESQLHQLQLTKIMMETQDEIANMKAEHSQQIESIHHHYDLQLQLQHTKTTMDMQGKIETMKAEHSRQVESIHHQHERELQLQHTKMTMDMQDKIANMKAEHSQQIESIHCYYDHKIETMKAEHSRQIHGGTTIVDLMGSGSNLNDSGSPFPRLESKLSMSDKPDPYPSTPPEKPRSAYSGEKKLVDVESCLDPDWIKVDMIVDKKDGKDGLSCLDTQPRPRERAKKDGKDRLSSLDTQPRPRERAKKDGLSCLDTKPRPRERAKKDGKDGLSCLDTQPRPRERAKKDGKDDLSNSDTHSRPRERAAAFNTKPEKTVSDKLQKPKPSKSTPRDNTYVDIDIPIHPTIQRAKPCWYCTNLTTLTICDVCGNEQRLN
jgi:serine/threonine protein kinase